MDLYDLEGEVRKLVKEELQWYRHYVGQVLDNNDTQMTIGRVQVAIMELNWVDTSMGVWACPRQGNSLELPAVGSWVEIYFLMGDPSRPVYLSGALEHTLDNPQIQQYKSFKTQVLFEDPNDHSNMVYDEDAKLLSFSIGGKTASDFMVLGTTLKTQLQKTVDALTQLQSDFTTWTPVPNDGGAALKTKVAAGFLTKAMSDLSSVLSTVMKGS